MNVKTKSVAFLCNHMADTPRPIRRDQFRVAVICALPREADAVTLLFDRFWDDDDDPYGRAHGDNNHYTTGRMGRHDVVLTTLPSMGTTSAAAASANLRSSYGGLRLALLVGICGGVPRISHHDAFLGDVVISKSIIQYDYGRQYPGRFVVRNSIEDSLGRANRDIRSLLSHFETERGREQLQSKSASHLKNLRETAIRKRRRANYQCPGRSEDDLFPPDYTHMHHTGCDTCSSEADSACDTASKASCVEVDCDKANRVVRQHPADDAVYTPEIFIGRIGSGNAVMKSGTDRDRIATQHGIIAFEMEGAGAWDEVPCVVVKGICDYADSHKNKKWQDFAAATAASVARAIVDRYVVDDEVGDSSYGDTRSAMSSSGPVTMGGNRSVSNNTFGDGTWINQGNIFGSGWTK